MSTITQTTKLTLAQKKTMFAKMQASYYKYLKKQIEKLNHIKSVLKTITS